MGPDWVSSPHQGPGWVSSLYHHGVSSLYIIKGPSWVSSLHHGAWLCLTPGAWLGIITVSSWGLTGSHHYIPSRGLAGFYELIMGSGWVSSPHQGPGLVSSWGLVWSHPQGHCWVSSLYHQVAWLGLITSSWGLAGYDPLIMGLAGYHIIVSSWGLTGSHHSIMGAGWVSSPHQGPDWLSSLHHGAWLGLIPSSGIWLGIITVSFWGLTGLWILLNCIYSLIFFVKFHLENDIRHC